MAAWLFYFCGFCYDRPENDLNEGGVAFRNERSHRYQFE